MCIVGCFNCFFTACKCHLPCHHGDWCGKQGLQRSPGTMPGVVKWKNSMHHPVPAKLVLYMHTAFGINRGNKNTHTLSE